MSIKLDDLLYYRLFKIVKLNEKLIEKNIAQFELSHTQWKIMARFNFLPAPCTKQKILASMGIDQSHLTRALEQLESRNLIKKERRPTDKRTYNIFLTNEGKKLVKKIERILQDDSILIEDGLSKVQIKQLYKLLDQLEYNIESAMENLEIIY